VKDWQLRAEWYGHAGHLCVGIYCRFHLCTIVGDFDQRFLVSTVGDYYRQRGQGDAGWKRETIGAGPDAWYETMVFAVGTERCKEKDCGCGLPDPVSWSELASRRYATNGEATRGHLELCATWADKTATDAERPEVLQ
jgi:hypothetical protein